MTVDQFVQRKVAPEFRDIVVELRSLMHKVAPEAREAISYGLPMYAMNKPLAWISPSTTGIALGFRQGAYFKDKYGLLKGTGKHARNVRMKTLKDVNRAALRSYIRQAVELDRE